MNYYVIALVLIFVVLFFIHRGRGAGVSGGSSSVPIVYGTTWCPHCKKLRETIGPHEFVDCDSQGCPDFVESYPTTKYPDGTIKIGA